ncbi:hypothetical protein BDV06DRAFT_214683 [Aspergillus oleicola]
MGIKYLISGSGLVKSMTMTTAEALWHSVCSNLLHKKPCREDNGQMVIIPTAGTDSTRAETAGAQAGVENIEAVAKVWLRTSLIIAYILNWIVYFLILMQQVTSSTLTPYVTSAFQSHSLTPTISILSRVIGGVFWTVGSNAFLYTMNIFVADTMSLRNRGLMTALMASPNVITIWLGGPISEAFLNGPGCEGYIMVERKHKIALTSVFRYCRDFDALGLLLLTAGLALFFLPFNLFSAAVASIPFSLLLDQNMVGACLLGTVLSINYFYWYTLFSSFLKVSQIYSLGNALFGIAAGWMIRSTVRYKSTLYSAIPIYALFTGLMVHFRTPESNTAMSAANHQHIAAIRAILGIFSSVGGAIGSTVAGTVWQGVFPTKIAAYLPSEEQGNILSIYGDIQIRRAIQRAYADAQNMMLAVGTAIWVVGFVAVALWRDTNVRGVRQVVGNVI